MIKKGSKGVEVQLLQRGLNLLGYECGVADGIFGSATDQAVEKFQKGKRLFVDGIVGKITAEAYNKALMNSGLVNARELLLIFDQDDSSVEEPGSKMKFVRCPADVFDGRSGYTRTTLREDAAEAYQALYEEVHKRGGMITSAGGKRDLRQSSGANRSRKSMHYVGIAFDMALPTGMYKPDEDPFIIERDQGRYWTVWCRTDHPSFEERSIKAVVCRRRKNAKGKSYTEIQEKIVTARVFNFTKLAKEFGFERIQARSSFFRGGSYGGAEWWHFQFEKCLTPGESKFGEELLKVYSLSECEKFQYWNEVKNDVYKKEWF